jgi:hypothetical protein
VTDLRGTTDGEGAAMERTRRAAVETKAWDAALAAAREAVRDAATPTSVPGPGGAPTGVVALRAHRANKTTVLPAAAAGADEGESGTPE